MSNEGLLIMSLLFVYGSVLVWFKLFGKTGLMCLNVLVTIAANIEVMIIVQAFGVRQTLGNILFASTFLITDVLSETYGKSYANKAVKISVFASVFFIIVSQTWFLYDPFMDDLLFTSMKKTFSNTPRVMVSGLIVYAVSQYLDVWLYHRTWMFTYKICGNKDRYLWFRNNFSTLLSQLVNAVLFTLFAFWGQHDFLTSIQIMFSSYVIFIFTSLLDTPVLYLARLIARTKK